MTHGAAASSTVGRDVLRYGAAVAVAVALGAVQVFVLPRRLDLATYGEYRFFLIYYGYIGILHFGLADGAFVRWAGMPRGTVRAEWPRVLAWMIALQGVMVALAVGLGTAAPPLERTYIVGFTAAALCANVATLMSYALQAVGNFQAAGLVAVLPPAVFVTGVLAAGPRTLGAVLATQVTALAVAATVGIVAVARIRDARAAAGRAPSPGSLVRVGLPVLGANLAAGVSQFADRILVSVSVPTTSLALYGFASTVMVAASAATQTLSRVALSHAARRPGATRATVLDGVYDLIAMGFGGALTMLPLFEYLVERTLPTYAPAIPIVRALVVGVPFWVAVHVVLVGTLQSYGKVRRQLALELAGTALVLLACGGCLMLGGPLWTVAAASSAAAIVIWGVGVTLVHRWVPESIGGHAPRFAARIAWQGTAVLAVALLPGPWAIRSLAYVLLAALPTFGAMRAARAQWRR
jgi:O-antigen/teichoic acid export membrane protein